MKLQIESGKKLLVHCRYGIGRTGTIVLAFLIATGYSFKEVEKSFAMGWIESTLNAKI